MTRKDPQTEINSSAIASSAPLLPPPRNFYSKAQSSSPWVSFDPLFRSECVALYRSARLTLLALFAFIAGPRTLRADPIERSDAGWTLPLQQQAAAGSIVESAAERECRRGTPLLRRVRKTQDAAPPSRTNVARPSFADLAAHRAHAPPALYAFERTPSSASSPSVLQRVPAFALPAPRLCLKTPPSTNAPPAPSALPCLALLHTATSTFHWDPLLAAGHPHQRLLQQPESAHAPPTRVPRFDRSLASSRSASRPTSISIAFANVPPGMVSPFVLATSYKLNAVDRAARRPASAFARIRGTRHFMRVPPSLGCPRPSLSTHTATPNNKEKYCHVCC